MKNLFKTLILSMSISISFCMITDIEKYKNGNIKKIKYYSNVNNQIKLVGVEKYYENGILEEKGQYENGKMIGNWSYYYSNGQVKGTGDYHFGDGSILGSLGIPRNGRHGLWKFWYENGQQQDQLMYLKGQKNGQSINWYENGQTRQKGNWKNGQPYGLWVDYYESGEIRIKRNHKVNELSEISVFHENGTIYIEGFFYQGIFPQYSFEPEGYKQMGSWIFYGNDGSVETKEIYDDGKLIETIEY